MTAPFNTPSALAREPWTAAFWAVCAPVLFPVVVMALAGAVLPLEGAFSADSPNADQLKSVWLIVCLGGVLQFGALSYWAQRIGAGPFAGSMQTSTQWLIAAVLIGPLLLIVPSVLVGALMSGQENWQYSGDVNKAVFARENWTLGYIFFGVLIAPVVEEVTFRGVALGTMIARGLSPYAAVVLSSAAFAFIHLQYSPAAMGVVFMTGLGLAVMRLMSGSMMVPIAAHIAANTDMLILQSLVSAQAG